MTRALLLVFAFASLLSGQPKRILYLTHSAGFRHDSIVVSRSALSDLAARKGQLEIVSTEDVGAISAANLERFDAVFFFTSGELALTADARRALLDFVRRGKGFGGVHSATDTLYTWPEYGELIGGYFDGHPWAQSVRVDIEDPEHPVTRGVATPWQVTEEIYQFREFSRSRVRVLMTLDVDSVSLQAPGTHPGTRDFPLAWVRPYGDGRVFYSALGHFDDTWRDPVFLKMMEGALLWLTGLATGDATPRAGREPRISGVGNAANLSPAGAITAGSLISVFGSEFTPSPPMATSSPAYSGRLAGVGVLIAGKSARLLYAGPAQINALVPAALEGSHVPVEVTSTGGVARVDVEVLGRTPGVFAVTAQPGAITVWATGVGARPADVQATIGGRAARLLFAGEASVFPGLLQINLETPAGLAAGPHTLELRIGDSAPFYSAAVLLP